MDFSLPDSGCWHSNKIQNNLIQVYTGKRAIEAENTAEQIPKSKKARTSIVANNDSDCITKKKKSKKNKITKDGAHNDLKVDDSNVTNNDSDCLPIKEKSKKNKLKKDSDHNDFVNDINVANNDYDCLPENKINKLKKDSDHNDPIANNDSDCKPKKKRSKKNKLKKDSDHNDSVDDINVANNDYDCLPKNKINKVKKDSDHNDPVANNDSECKPKKKKIKLKKDSAHNGSVDDINVANNDYDCLPKNNINKLIKDSDHNNLVADINFDCIPKKIKLKKNSDLNDSAANSNVAGGESNCMPKKKKIRKNKLKKNSDQKLEISGIKNYEDPHINSHVIKEEKVLTKTKKQKRLDLKTEDKTLGTTASKSEMTSKDIPMKLKNDNGFQHQSQNLKPKKKSKVKNIKQVEIKQNFNQNTLCSSKLLDQFSTPEMKPSNSTVQNSKTEITALKSSASKSIVSNSPTLKLKMYSQKITKKDKLCSNEITHSDSSSEEGSHFNMGESSETDEIFESEYELDSTEDKIFVCANESGDDEEDGNLVNLLKDSEEYKNLMSFLADERKEKIPSPVFKHEPKASLSQKRQTLRDDNKKQIKNSVKHDRDNNISKCSIDLNTSTNTKQNKSQKRQTLSDDNKKQIKKSVKHDRDNNISKCSIDLNTNTNTFLNHTTDSKSDPVKNKAVMSLHAARFRMLNEKLYSESGREALKYFQSNVEDFKDYHDGYMCQVKKWPINPVDVIIKDLYKSNKNLVIADMGCGEAKIAQTFPDRKIHSFDLVALNEYVTCCEFSQVRLISESVDIVIFCLSLMGTNLKQYLYEAYRILKTGGTLKIAEVESRIEDLKEFITNIEFLGFELLNQDVAHKVFVFLNFNKVKVRQKKRKAALINLKPCLYKKR